MAPSNATLNIALRARDMTGRAFASVTRGLNQIRRTAGRSLSGITRNLTGFQNQAAALLGVLGGFQAIVKGPADFANELAKVGTLGEEARQRLGEFREEIQTLSVGTGVGTNELAQGLFNVISAGTDASNAMNVLRESTKLAVAGAADVNSVVSGLSVVANSFNVTTTEGFRELGQKRFAAQVIGKTTIEDLSNNVGKLGATFADSSIDVTQMFTALADITTVSSNTEEAATSLRAAITAILKPSDQLKRVMTDVGIPIGQAAFEGRNLGEIFAAIGRRSRELNIPLAQVIGNVRAVTAAVTLGAENGDRYNRALEKQKGFLGELDQSYDLMQSTLQSALDQFGNLAQVLSQEFSDTLLSGLGESLLSAVEKTDQLKLQARLAGLELRLAFENAQPALKNFLALIQGFLVSIRAGFNTVIGILDELSEELMDNSLARALGLEVRDPVELFNERLKQNIDRRKDLTKQLDQVNQTLIDANQIDQQRFEFGERGDDLGVQKLETDRRFKTQDQQLVLLVKQQQLEAQLRKSNGGLKDLMDEREDLLGRGARSGEDPRNAFFGENFLDPAFKVGEEKIEQDRLRKALQRDTDILADVVGQLATGGEVNLDEMAKLEESIRSTRAELERLERQGSKSPMKGLEEANETLSRHTALLHTYDMTWQDLGETSETVLNPLIEKIETMAGKFIEGFTKAAEKTESLEESITKVGERAFSTATDALGQFFDSVVTGSDRGKEAFKGFLKSITSEINRMMAQKVIQRFMAMMAGFGGSAVTGISESLAAQTTTNAFPPISIPRLPGFSQGGIVTSPTAALIGEGGMSEAVVPLPNGRSIPVKFNQGPRGGDTINIHISAMDGPSVERVLSSESGRRAIEGAVRNAKGVRRDLR